MYFQNSRYRFSRQGLLFLLRLILFFIIPTVKDIDSAHANILTLNALENLIGD